MLLWKFLFTVVTSLPAFWCSLSIGKVESDTFIFENGILSAVFSGEYPGKCLFQQSTENSPSKLYLQGFMFDEENVKLFSNAICEIHLQDLTLDGCYINNALISLLSFPSGLKSIRLERLDLTSWGIHRILDKLSPSLESLEVVDCLNIKPIQSELSDLSKFSLLKTISIDHLESSFNSNHLLLSLSLLPLERLKLSCVYLTTEELTRVLSKWNEPNGCAFFNSLKEFDLILNIDNGYVLIQLVQFLFSVPNLKIISLNANYRCKDVSLPPLPSNIKQLSLPFIKVFMEDGNTSFYNLENLSHLTHLTVKDSFKVFPYYLFDLSKLEYLNNSDQIDCNCPLKIDRRCSNIKYLSIQSIDLVPLLDNFENNFPVIETLIVKNAHSKTLDSDLIKIISSKTLKCLEIKYDDSEQPSLSIGENITSSIEELKITGVCWEFVFDLLSVKRFPLLKKIHIETKTIDLELERVFGKLSTFPQLSSLTITGDFSVSRDKMQFTFENLKFFHFKIYNETFDLDNLLSCMPNLIEFQLAGGALKELELQNQVNIRYLALPSKFSEDKRIFVNFVKNIPNLIQCKKYICSRIENHPVASELAYYLKELKKYFNDELQFEINPNCFPIKQFEYDDNLLKLIRLKSPKLQNYFTSIFPIDIFKPVLKQIFTIEIGKDFNANLVKIFFDFLEEFKVSGEEDISLARKVLLEGKNEWFTESTNFPLNNFYKLFSNHLTNCIGINFESDHLKFIEDFFKANKKYGPLKIYKFLKSFLISASVANGQIRIINMEIFNLFSPYLLDSFSLLFEQIKKGQTSPFISLFNQIKKDNLNEEEEKSLTSNLKSIAVNLKELKTEQYNELSAHFKDILMKVNYDSFVENFLDIVKVASIPNPECPICMESLFTKECKFFKSLNVNCHLFHSDCLNRWLKVNKSCPQCRRQV